MTRDKQLRSVKLANVLEKRRLGQALNLKEFAVSAGVSYSLAREWVQLPGFPRFQGVIFWEDFVQWRVQHNFKTTLRAGPDQSGSAAKLDPMQRGFSNLPARAAQILLETVK